MPTAVNDAIVLQHLPATLVSEWEDNINQSPVWGKWLHGSLMHCDVTGFTAMSESLAESGKEGAELMAAILNQFFERMLSIANVWGGVQMKFGGDAMLVYFPEAEHAQRATGCGLNMQAAMKEFNKVTVADKVCELRMRIGIHSGSFYSASVGQNRGLLHYLLIGKDVNYSAEVESMAQPGQVVISNTTAKYLKDKCQLKVTKYPDVWQVKSVTDCHVEENSARITNKSRHILKRYLMPPVAEGKVADVTGEHRRVSVVFIYLNGLSESLTEKGEEQTLAEINTYINKLIELATQFGGYLAASDTSEHGDKLIVLFGAPVSLDKQEYNAIRFVCELRDYISHSEFNFTQQTGVNTGYVFAGAIGSKERREYTCIGDVVNLSARLMASAWSGNVLVSALTADRSIDGFIWHRMTPIKVKGKSKAIEIFKLMGEDLSEESATDLNNRTPFVGRQVEYKKILYLAQTSHDNKWPVCCHVYGESGIGKSRLCYEVLNHLYKKGWQRFTGICHSYSANSAYSAWIDPLRLLFGVTNSDSDNIAWGKIKNTVDNLCPEISDFSPLVAEILGIRAESNVVVLSLDAKSKRDKSMTLIASIIKEVAELHPVLMVFDNADWMDTSSAELIGRIIGCKSISVLFCVISNTDDLSSVFDVNSVSQTIPLGELNAEDAEHLVSSITSISDENIKILAGRAKGNPLFLEELSKNVSEGQSDLPETINDVIMAKLDRLNNGKKVLQYASIIGETFNKDLLKRMIFGIRGADG
ncbi:MAG: AAA family ATPase [Gammaproteobacteria bacterium]|nr:AAA family ATPase [Gammaproteobacteria bacterium]